MASILDFQDLGLNLNLNLTPTPPSPSAAPATSAAAILKTPKLEPKQEPFDDTSFHTHQYHHQQPLHPCFSASALGFFTDSQLTPPSDNSVFSEYHRISDLFRTAFAHRLHDSCDAVSVPDDPDSLAIVPVTGDDNQNSVASASPRHSRRYPPRSSELVRVTELGEDDRRHFRDSVRRTRMIFDSLRIFCVAEEEKRLRDDAILRRSRPRGDLLAASVMRDRGLWLNLDKRIVGSIPGIYVGDLFFFRMELCVVGLHGQVQAGIDYLTASRSSNGEPIATSVIVSGGYEDDEDKGDVIIYTGQGGQDKFSKQCMNQKLEGGNWAMERSMHYGIEVRVIRGLKYTGSLSQKVYVYDGLYRICSCWFDVGKSGFGVYKYKLLRIDGQPEMGSTILKLARNLRIEPLSVRPRGYVGLDISNKKETLPVMLFNDIDSGHDPMCYAYLTRTAFPPCAFNHGSNGTGCECVNGCVEGCFCAMKNGGEFAYDQNGFLLRGKPLVFECSTFCRCPPTCRNRVTQGGLRNRLEVFRSRRTGWGVRSLDLIHAGAFICEYAGIVLTREQAQLFIMNGDSLIYPNQFSNRWEEWGDLSQIYSDYAHPSYPSIPPLDFAMDVSRMRNVACYISHSSSPNVFVQFVLYDHNNLMFPHLMLFAMENIPPLRELSLDYGVADEWSGKLSICS